MPCVWRVFMLQMVCNLSVFLFNLKLVFKLDNISALEYNGINRVTKLLDISEVVEFIGS